MGGAQSSNRGGPSPASPAGSILQSVSAPSELFSRLQAALGPQYRLERELGHGGMGVVFLARDTTLDRAVAVKVVHPDLAVHGSVTQRFLAEARMIARLRHPNIVAVHAAGEATGLFWYVMDYVPGESLRQRLARDERLPVAQVAEIVADLADALHAAGQAGLVHRDVKPENILLDSATGRALLADFGIARAMVADPTGTLTAQGVAVGTPTYMSPEQAAGEAVDHRSDLYGLGVVAYEMLAGRPPFRAANAAAVASMHLSEKPTPVQALRPDTPAPLGLAIMRALEKDPLQRWQTGAELRRSIQTGEVPARLRPRIPRLARIGLTLVVALAALAYALRPGGPAKGVNPRLSILVLPFVNVRDDPGVEWLREGSVNMLTLNLSQWTDLNVVDHERLHDLLGRRHLRTEDPIGLDMARRLARDAGAWTVVLGDYIRAGDSLHLVARVYDVASGQRVEVAQVDGQPGEDVRPLFDQLAARLLDLSGAPNGISASLAQVTTPSLEAYRSYLRGIEALSRWDLGGAEQHLRRSVALDSTFGLAYYKLSLTRGWVAGQGDSLGILAIQRATRHAARLPEHDRAMIGAYQAFIDGDYAGGRDAYRRLLARDSTDADAWYGLGDVTFHNTSMADRPANWTESLRAFKRAIALDPGYYLAYEHLSQIYFTSALPKPMLALLPGDSLTAVRYGGGRSTPDSLTLLRAGQLARDDGLAMARNWLTSQPDNAHAQNALLRAEVVRGDQQGALASVTQFTRPGAPTRRPDLPFVRARLQAAGGEVNDAVKTVARALDTTRADQFDAGQLPALEAVSDVASAANILMHTGRVQMADDVLQLAAGIRSEWNPEALWAKQVGGRSLYGQLLSANLYAAIGAPERLKPIWDAISEEARQTPKATRSQVTQYGWAAAVGLFLANPSDPTPLNQLQALGGGELPPELLAVLAIGKGDSAEAKRLLALPDSAMPDAFKGRPVWHSFRIPVAAAAWLSLGQPERSLRLLERFPPSLDELALDGQPDFRWGLAGQVRLLRAAALEKLGRTAEAASEYRQVLAQWEGADGVVEPWLRQARVGLARVEGKG
jgi:eukaryotic-like serine/threonine-protein kinase